jgi:DNA-binding winged helix-turn-helix (wHTH) protein
MSMRVRFGEFTFDGGARQLRRSGRSIRLSSKASAILEALIERRPAVVTKAELTARVWPDTHVSEANLYMHVADLRRALDDEAREPRFIRTESGSGYAFFADVVDLESERPRRRTRPSARCWLEWDGRRIMLHEGPNSVGRHPDCDVWIDEPRVSSEHAQITVTERTAVIEDRRSKNGTYVQGARLTSPRPLADRDVVRFCTTELTFRVLQPRTETVKHVDAASSS